MPIYTTVEAKSESASCYLQLLRASPYDGSKSLLQWGAQDLVVQDLAKLVQVGALIHLGDNSLRPVAFRVHIAAGELKRETLFFLKKIF